MTDTASTIELCLTGDVMTGRGIDQILPTPGDPRIHESWAKSAERYVELAEDRIGPIPRSVPPEYIWGDILAEIEHIDPDAFVVNLETAVTDRGRPWPGKGIQYRMHPANIGCLEAAGIDIATLANNHVMDWSLPGLLQTLEVLSESGIETTGAGRTESDAWAAATVNPPAGSRVVVLGVGSVTSGIPSQWAASPGRPGVALLPDFSDDSVAKVARAVEAEARTGDVVVLSVHWGGNWGYPIPDGHRRFARQVIDTAGVHVVHGHSSHHPVGIEIHRGHPIIYGCGDLITDYEGIRGHEEYRGELGALYHPTIDPSDGTLTRFELVPTEMERFRLTHPSDEDVQWLAGVLDTESAELGTRVSVNGAGRIELTW